MAGGPVTIDMTIGERPSILDGIGSATAGSGNAGNATVTAGVLTITNNGRVENRTTGAGNSGGVSVTVTGMLSLNGSGGIPGAPTGIIGDFRQPAPGLTGKRRKRRYGQRQRSQHFHCQYRRDFEQHLRVR